MKQKMGRTSRNINLRPLELLAPARNVAIAREAIKHGADAVYIGATSHGARSKASNSIADIAELVRFAKPYGVKIYVTVNTIIYDSEIKEVERLIRDLYYAGVDALIVQDMAIQEMDIPPIALHASTQCDTRTAEKARFLQEAGFSQIVIARESSLEETRKICEAVSVPVEVFVHGALCVSYSGDCRASLAATGRSANRGCCAQICRLPFDLIDGDGKIIEKNKHLLSLRDMNRSASLEQLIEAGATSFKIEGRLKDASYVKNVTAAYRVQLDEIIARHPDKYCRASRGISDISFVPDLSRSFNRGFTEYFLSGESKDKIAQFATPKSIGNEIGKVNSANQKFISASIKESLNNGDGLTFQNERGEFEGFRLNRIEGGRLYPRGNVKIPAGAKLYRNYDKAWEDILGGETAVRKIPVAMDLRAIGENRICLSGTIEGVGATEVVANLSLQPARQSGLEARRRILAKLGETPFVLEKLNDGVDPWFVPASELTALRRSLVEAMLETLAAIKPIELRRPANPALRLEKTLTVHDNVSNELARRFYESIGAKVGERAAEVVGKVEDGSEVMVTRYCLRRELGACLKEREGKQLKGPLMIRSGATTFRLDFDCKECRMRVVK